MKKYKTKTTEEFVEEATIKHEGKYLYFKTNYINAKTKVIITCPLHGDFEQIPRYHISGQKCSKCSNVYMDKEYFLEKSNTIHGDKYNYSKIEYVNNRIPIKIICPKHGEFKQKPKDHLLGKGCSKCCGKNKTTTDFITEVKLIHNDKYDYSKVEYINAKTKVEIICSSHGSFYQTPNSHKNGKGCPICNESKGEKEIRKYLIKNKINFIPQHKFPDCKNIKPLPFDFYLPDYNTCIEFNGIQHYKPIKYLGGLEKFKKLTKNDTIKVEYCKNNNINLLIINDIKNIVINL